MLTVTTPVTISITAFEVPPLNQGGDFNDNAEADKFRFRVYALTAGGVRVPADKTREYWEIIVTNGACQGVQLLEGARLDYSTVDLPTGYTNLKTAVAAASGKAAKRRALETFAAANGLLFPGVVT